jgi:hypothetical protein
MLIESVPPTKSLLTRPSFGMLKPTTTRFLSIAAGETMFYALTAENTMIRWNKSGVARVFEATDVQNVAARGRFTVRQLTDHTFALFSGGRRFNISHAARIVDYAVGGTQLVALTDDARILRWDIHDIHTRSHPTVTHLGSAPATPIKVTPAVTTTTTPPPSRTDDRTSSPLHPADVKPIVELLSTRVEKSHIVLSAENSHIWVCSHCESINSASSSICDICDTDRLVHSDIPARKITKPIPFVYLILRGCIHTWDVRLKCKIKTPTNMADIIALPGRHDVDFGISSKQTMKYFGATVSPDDPRNPPSENMQITQIATGFTHMLALKADRSVVAWGSNEYGQANAYRVQNSIIAIAAGAYHSLALVSNGIIRAWGNNDCGQVTPPKGLYRVRAIAAGDSHSLALKDDGTLVAWGRNTDGQSTVPPEAQKISAIACGGNHSIALTSTGSVLCWGSNKDAQLDFPTGLKNVVAITAGDTFSMALCADESLHVWGNL